MSTVSRSVDATAVALQPDEESSVAAWLFHSSSRMRSPVLTAHALTAWLRVVGELAGGADVAGGDEDAVALDDGEGEARERVSPLLLGGVASDALADAAVLHREPGLGLHVGREVAPVEHLPARDAARHVGGRDARVGGQDGADRLRGAVHVDVGEHAGPSHRVGGVGEHAVEVGVAPVRARRGAQRRHGPRVEPGEVVVVSREEDDRHVRRALQLRHDELRLLHQGVEARGRRGRRRRRRRRRVLRQGGTAPEGGDQQGDAEDGAQGQAHGMDPSAGESPPGSWPRR